MAGTKGRTKGRPSRAQALLAMAQSKIDKELGEKNFDPVVFMLLSAADPSLPIDLRIASAAKAAPYVHSTLKAIEVTGEDGGPIAVDLSDSKQRLASMLKAVQGVVLDEDSPYPDSPEVQRITYTEGEDA